MFPCVCACVRTCGPCAQPRLREALRVRHMQMAVSHGRAVDAVTDSLVKFQQSVCVCVCVK